jgi:cytochrome c oxidase subunit IV
LSDSTETLPVPAPEGAVPALAGPAHAPAQHAHPQPVQYVIIGVVLVIITALEIAVSYLDEKTIGPNWIILMLGVMAVVKFTLVVSWYMHLKTDSRTLRRFFILGLTGALILFTIVALVLHAFQPAYNHVPR